MAEKLQNEKVYNNNRKQTDHGPWPSYSRTQTKSSDPTKAGHPWATALTLTAYVDKANDFKILLDVHKYGLFPATGWNFIFLSQFYTII